MKTKFKEIEHKGYYELNINGINLGLFERSELRQLIEELDNLIHH